MEYYYSPSTKGFYRSDIHGNLMPADAVIITQAEHAELITAQSLGKIIQADENGKPIAVAPPEPSPPTLEELRAEKEAALAVEKRRVKDGGFMVDGVLFDSDAAARTAYLEFNAFLAIDPTYSEEWKASGDTWVTLDATLFAKIVEASKQHTSSVFAWLKQQQTALKAAMTVEEIEAVSINFDD